MIVGVRQLNVPVDWLERAWAPHEMSVGVRGHASARNAILVPGHDCIQIDEDVVPMAPPGALYEALQGSPYDVAAAKVRGTRPGVTLAAMLYISAEVSTTIGGFRGYGPDEVIEDQDYFWRAKEAGFRVGTCDEALISTGAETNGHLAGAWIAAFKGTRARGTVYVSPEAG